MAYQAPTAKLGTLQYSQQLAQQAKALGLNTPPSLLSGSGTASATKAPTKTPLASQPSSSVLKAGGWDTLNNYTPPQLGKPAAGIVPQVYANSTTTPGGGVKDYTSPSSSFASAPASTMANSTPAYTPQANQPAQVYNSSSNSFLSKAATAIKGAIGSVFSDNSTPQPASANLALNQNQNQPQQLNTTPTINENTGTEAVQTVAPTPQVAPRIQDQYSVITQDKGASSEDQKKRIDVLKQQEDTQKAAQVQAIQTQLAQKRAELAALQQQNPETPVDQNQQQTQPFSYNPEGQSNIANLTAQINAMEAEINKALEGSPEYQAASQALDAKVAEEAAINARLTQGKANVAEQPVAYNFISGQQAALQNRANADLQTNAAQRIPLQQRLATEQAKKQAAIDVAKNKYNFLSDERSRAESAYTTNYNRANTVADRATEQANKLTLEQAKPKTTTKSTSSNTSNDNVTALKNALNQSKFQGAEADGKYADPNLYLQNYQSYPDKAEFLRLFPPATYINPANTWLPAEIMQFVKQARSI